MKRITLTNSFHGRSVSISASWGDTPWEAWVTIQYARQDKQDTRHDAAVRVYKRIHQRLCGITECACMTVNMINQEIGYA